MCNVDTLRKVIKRAKAVRGPDSGPGSLLWFTLLDYILYQSFRLYQHGHMEGKLETFKSFKQFQKERQRNKSYRSFLFCLCNYTGGLESTKMDEYFPGLRQQIDHRTNKQDSANLQMAQMNSQDPLLQRITGHLNLHQWLENQSTGSLILRMHCLPKG